MNLMPMNYGGTKQIGQLWGNIISQIPTMIREDKKFQLEMQKIGDVEKINDTAFTQLKAVCGENGIDPGIIPQPIQGQNPEEYLTKSIETFMNAAKNQDIDPKSVVDSLSKLSGAGAIEEVQGAQEHFGKKRETESALFGRDLSEAAQFGGGVSVGGREGEGGGKQYEDIMSAFTKKPSPYELPEGAEGSVGGSLDQIVQEKEVKSQAIPIMEDPELMNQLQLLPRAQRRLVMKKLQDPDEKYYETDALKEIADYVKAQTTLQQEKEKAGLTHKRGLEKQEEAITTTAQEGRKSKTLDTYLNALVNNELYDLEGNPVEYFNIGEALKGNYQVGKKRPTEHITTVVGGGGKGKEGAENVKLLKIYKDDSAKAMTSLQNIEKYLQDPKSAAGRQIAKDEGIDSAEDARKRQLELQKIIGDNTYKAQQIEKRLQITQQPGEGGETDPTANMTPKDKQAYEWANTNSTDPRAAQILEKLKVTYGF